MISPQAKFRIENFIASVEEEGGKILLDGRGTSVPDYPDGNWVGPSVIEVTTDMKAYQYVAMRKYLLTAAGTRSSVQC